LNWLADWPNILSHEGGWRWVVTFAVFFVVATWETLSPFRDPTASTSRRWAGHFALLFVTTWLVGLLLPFSAVAAALAVEDSPYGLLNRPWTPAWAAWLIAIPLLDFVRYGQHWLVHRVPLLWRLHKVHHSDPDYDLTTALRFHPVEALFTAVTQCAAIALLAPPPMAVLAGELLFLVQVHLVHGNVAFPEAMDRFLRPVLVTPNLHAVHHSAALADQNSNYGGVFSIWDRLCGTFRTRASAERAQMTMGLEGYAGERGILWSTLFLLPFQRTPDELYPISSRSRPAASSQPPPARGS
jgi:sterol desaturase/sphingolipid hydroxylase (fatty acid hydroxylase superfamily)